VSNRHGFVLAIALFVAALNGGAAGPLLAQESEGQGKKKQYVAANSKENTTAGKQSPIISAGADPALLSGYHLGPDDELTISVWHEPELSQGVVIRPDGAITLPLLNDVKVAGLTTTEAQALLTEKMRGLVNDPQVTVIVKTIKSQKVFLVGNVTKQGAYPLSGQTTLELIAEAGGLGPFAKKASIYVLRKQNGKEIRLPFNYKKALSGKGSNPALQPGDMVVVP
jgi:polysaccharide export outer membrane protein